MDQKIEIPAIHDRDLRRVLDQFGIASKIDNGEIKCARCQKTITWDNLFAIKVLDNNLLLFCDDPDCIEFSNH